jgi:hypothetical protein
VSFLDVLPRMTEARWQAQVLTLARMFGWRTYRMEVTLLYVLKWMAEGVCHAARNVSEKAWTQAQSTLASNRRTLLAEGGPAWAASRGSARTRALLALDGLYRQGWLWAYSRRWAKGSGGICPSRFVEAGRAGVGRWRGARPSVSPTGLLPTRTSRPGAASGERLTRAGADGTCQSKREVRSWP